MKVIDAASTSIKRLLSIYDDREAQNIVSILFDDLFEISNINSELQFSNWEELESALQRLEKSEPIQYVTGKSNFYGLNFKINRHVLIPRPETEELVHWILSDVKGSKKQLDLLDVGIGSGCISLTLKKKHPYFRIFGVDYSLDTLNVARINSRKLKTPTTFYSFDFLDESYWSDMGIFDVIVSNPPYISDKERVIMADNVLLYEPERALFVGDDPLIFYKSIHKFSLNHLRKDGFVYLELNELYADDIEKIFQKVNSKVEIRKDLQGKKRMMKVTYFN